MKKPSLYHVALGSNKGDTFKNLQNAVDLMHWRIGHIKLISKVYKSSAFGFKGDDFLNCCLVLQSYLEPEAVLKKLLDIETTLGRTRTQQSTYEARTIDLDIIFVEDRIIDTPVLKVPHPEMHKREFVLLPLNDLAPKVKHPKRHQSVSDLLAACKDNSVITSIKIWLKNPSKTFNFSKYDYLVIEGNIGVGKTSLATKIAHDFNAKLILERFADNPFLPKFYHDASRYAFPLEMSFLADRYQQVSDNLSQLDLFQDFIVSDYEVLKSLIFSKVTLQDDEFKLYQKLFYLMYKDLRKPDLYIYLKQDIKRLQENIKKRGRDYEQNIADDYLEKINAGYLSFLENQTDFNMKIIDVSDRDFVENRSDYLWVLSQI